MAIVWSLNPLLYETLPQEVIKSFVGDLIVIQHTVLFFIVLSIMYPITNCLLKKHFKNYNGIESAARRVVVIHHALETIVLTLATPFFTYFMIKLNFDLHDLHDVHAQEGNVVTIVESIGSDIRSTMILNVGFMMMYLYEIVSRYESPRPILVLHHLLAVLDGYLTLLFPTSVMVKTCTILVYFICLEAVTFAGLFMYRMFPLSKYTPRVIFTGMVLFGVTRPVQVLCVGAAAFGSWGDPNHVKWQAIMQFSLTCVFTFIQAWSLIINFSLWKRSCDKIKCHGIEQVDGIKDDTDTDRTAGTVQRTIIADTDASNVHASMAESAADSGEYEFFDFKTASAQEGCCDKV